MQEERLLRPAEETGAAGGDRAAATAKSEAENRDHQAVPLMRKR